MSVVVGFQKFFRFMHRLFDPELVYYASSLSFYTIFTIIPLLLVLFSILLKLPSFDSFYEHIKSFIFSHILPSHQEAIEQYIDLFILNSSHIEIMGIVYVLFTSIMFFQNYEYIVNRIFNSRPRNFWNSLTLYWTMITLLPIVLALSIYLSIKFYRILEDNGYALTVVSLNLLPFPYLVMWFLFFVTYKISVAVKVRNRVLILTSLLSSSIWEIAKSGFVYYVVYNQTYLSIYGSFSILMFFFLWIYVSWIIFLYGLKLNQLFRE
jgi:membrane protein